MDWTQAAVLIGAGLAAGFQNTLAGGGSVWTLPALEWATGSPTSANATNRIAILLQNVVAVHGYHRGGAVPWKLALRLSVPTVIGGILGAWLATQLDAASMRVALALGVVAVAVASVIRRPETPRLKGRSTDVAFFLVGLYMGFLQVGVGFALLACLAGGLGLDLVKANGAKVLIVLVVVVPVLAVFGLHGQVEWLPGLVIASGNMTGAWIGARVATRKGASWIRVVVVIAAIAAVTKLLLLPSGPR